MNLSFKINTDAKVLPNIADLLHCFKNLYVSIVFYDIFSSIHKTFF